MYADIKIIRPSTRNVDNISDRIVSIYFDFTEHRHRKHNITQQHSL